MALGAHVSISGGIHLAPARGKEIGAEAIQIFTRNQMRWTARKITEKEIANFQPALKANGIRRVITHDSYLINLSTGKVELRKKSIDAFIDELKRAELLGIPYVVFHPGAHGGDGEEIGIKRTAEALNEVFAKLEEYSVIALIETTAGQGSNIGHKFEHIASIIDLIDDKSRIGTCIDTAHIFEAGYDIRTREAYEETIHEFDSIVGLDKVHAMHLNDSKTELGSHVDRHENIGMGLIGIDAFRFIVNDKRFDDIAMVLETPGGMPMFKRNLEILKSLRE